MALIRWEPARELHSLQSEFNRLFSVFDSQTGARAPGARSWVPAIDLSEEDGDYVLRADLPGVSESDVKVEVEGRVLQISGERSSEHEERKGSYRRIERASGRFSRVLTLPVGVDPESVSAQFDKGVLEVRVPKPAERKPHRVAIGGRGEGAPVIDGEAPKAA
jgi:HSP20 family protein